MMDKFIIRSSQQSIPIVNKPIFPVQKSKSTGKAENNNSNKSIISNGTRVTVCCSNLGADFPKSVKKVLSYPKDLSNPFAIKRVDLTKRKIDTGAINVSNSSQVPKKMLTSFEKTSKDYKENVAVESVYVALSDDEADEEDVGTNASCYGNSSHILLDIDSLLEREDSAICHRKHSKRPTVSAQEASADANIESYNDAYNSNDCDVSIVGTTSCPERPTDVVLERLDDGSVVEWHSDGAVTSWLPDGTVVQNRLVECLVSPALSDINLAQSIPLTEKGALSETKGEAICEVLAVTDLADVSAVVALEPRTGN